MHETFTRADASLKQWCRSVKCIKHKPSRFKPSQIRSLIQSTCFSVEAIALPNQGARVWRTWTKMTKVLIDMHYGDDIALTESWEVKWMERVMCWWPRWRRGPCEHRLQPPLPSPAEPPSLPSPSHVSY